MQKILLFQLILCQLLYASTKTASDKFIYSTNDESRILYVYDAKNQISTRLYEAPSGFRIDSYGQSPAGKQIALLETNGEHMRKGDLGYAIKNLVIINQNGKVLKRIKNVLEYSWSPAGNSIAFIRGLDYGGMELKPEGIWLLSLSNLNTEDKLSDVKASDIQWARHNNKIYVKWKEVYELDPREKTSTKTDFQGIFFSEDGKYYFRPNYEGTGFKLFDTGSNKEIALKSIDNKKVNFYRWIKDSHLIVGDITFEKRVLSAKRGDSLSSFSGKVIGFNPKTSEIYVHKDKKAFRGLAKSSIERMKLELN